ncbi:hypothetical protein Hanom_Chr14g01331771 [Helianthus anomalus]
MRNFFMYETSRKAKRSVEKNNDRPRVGRMGFVGLQKFEEYRWKQLVESYPHLQKVEDERVQRYVVSRAFYNSVTESYERVQRYAYSHHFLYSSLLILIA